MKLLVKVLLFIVISSCSSFVNKMHGQITRGEQAQAGRPVNARSANDPYNFYRKGSRTRNTRPVTYRNDNYPQKVKREYKKRYSAEDLEDSRNTSSLWSGSGKNNVLFSSDESKKIGDLLIVQVKSKLKTDISNELKRAFPVYTPKKKKEEKKPDEAAKQTFNNPNVSQDEGGDKEGDKKTYDIFSSKITDVVNQQYLIIKGRKEIIFRKRKHFIEIQGMISRKDVYDFDKVDSSELLDARIFILR